MELAQEADMLRKVPMFVNLETSKLKLLAFTSEIIHYDNNDILFRQGDAADCAYVVMDGSVDVITESDNGPLLASNLGINTLFGEIALIINTPRSATLMAHGALTVMKITVDMFHQLLKENADFSLDVMRQLSQKLLKSHQLVEVLQKERASAE